MQLWPPRSSPPVLIDEESSQDLLHSPSREFQTERKSSCWFAEGRLTCAREHIARPNGLRIAGPQSSPLITSAAFLCSYPVRNTARPTMLGPLQLSAPSVAVAEMSPNARLCLGLMTRGMSNVRQIGLAGAGPSRSRCVWGPNAACCQLSVCVFGAFRRSRAPLDTVRSLGRDSRLLAPLSRPVGRERKEDRSAWHRCDKDARSAANPTSGDPCAP